MRQVSESLRLAIESPQRTTAARLSVDWDGDGHRGGLDEIGDRAASVSASSALQTGTPEQARVVEGSAAATMSADLTRGLGTEARDADAVRHFSPSQVDSPLYGKERLNRDVELDAAFLTSSGWERVPVLRGRTRGLPVDVGARKATVTAVDYRHRLRTPVTLPGMAADAPEVPNITPVKPGLEASWIVSYVLWQCGFPLSPTPPPQCVLWVPMHGSAMPFLGKAFSGAPGADGTWIPGGFSPGPYFRCEFEDGPFFLGTRAARTLTGSNFEFWESYPQMRPEAEGGAPMFRADGRSSGRFTAWLRTGPGLGLQNLTVFINNETTSSVYWYAATNLLDITNGVTTRTVDGPNIPSDGAWHLVGVQWDDVAGRAVFNVDGVLTEATFTPTPANTGGDNTTTTLLSWAQPCAEVQISTGIGFTEPWPPTRFTPQADVDRSQNQRLTGIVPSSAPREAWAILEELAQAEQGAMWLDPVNGPTYATRERLVSPAAQTIQREIRAAPHMLTLATGYDLDKVMNVVSGSYTELDVAVSVPLWTLQQTVRVEAGSDVTLYVTFSGGLASGNHRITGETNTAVDGSGSVWYTGDGVTSPVTSTYVITSETTATVTVHNGLGTAVYLVNAEGQADLAIIGDSIQSGSGGTSPAVVNESSVEKYGQVPYVLPSNQWVQTLSFAWGLAMATAGDLGEPVQVVTDLKIPGDPRLQYYDRVYVVDEQSSGIALPMWITGLGHAWSPAMYETTVAARAARNRYYAGVSAVGVDFVG